jgi:prepilin-type N-terminal cleavage/methylation domain-containing protein
MKLHLHSTELHAGAPTRRHQAFTLPEVMVAMTVFLLLLGGIVFAHLFGLSMFRLTETKLNATDAARQTIGRMADEIRSCKSTWIGHVKNGEFVALLDGEKQQGSGLLIHPTTNTADYVIYFVNPSDRTFRRTTSAPGSASVVAESITNAVVFQARDHLGQVLTNNQNNRVMYVNLEFYQPRRHLQQADYYKLETAVTRRTLE